MAQACPGCGSEQVWGRAAYWRSLSKGAADWVAHHPPSGEVVVNRTPPVAMAAVAVAAFAVGDGWGIVVGLLAVLMLGGWVVWRRQAIQEAADALRAWEAAMVCRGCGGVFAGGAVETA